MDDWQPCFEALNRQIEDGAEIEATVEVVTELVDETEAERLPLDGITHEDGDDQIAVGLGGRGSRYPAVLWHFVDRPRRVSVVEDDGRPRAFVIESEDEALTLVRLYGR